MHTDAGYSYSFVGWRRARRRDLAQAERELHLAALEVDQLGAELSAVRMLPSRPSDGAAWRLTEQYWRCRARLRDAQGAYERAVELAREAA